MIHTAFPLVQVNLFWFNLRKPAQLAIKAVVLVSEQLTHNALLAFLAIFT